MGNSMKYMRGSLSICVTDDTCFHISEATQPNFSASLDSPSTPLRGQLKVESFKNQQIQITYEANTNPLMIVHSMIPDETFNQSSYPTQFLNSSNKQSMDSHAIGKTTNENEKLFLATDHLKTELFLALVNDNSYDNFKVRNSAVDCLFVTIMSGDTKKLGLLIESLLQQNNYEDNIYEWWNFSELTWQKVSFSNRSKCN